MSAAQRGRCPPCSNLIAPPENCQPSADIRMSASDGEPNWHYAMPESMDNESETLRAYRGLCAFFHAQLCEDMLHM